MIQNPAIELRQSCQLGDYLHNNTNKPRDNHIFDAIKKHSRNHCFFNKKNNLEVDVMI